MSSSSIRSRKSLERSPGRSHSYERSRSRGRAKKGYSERDEQRRRRMDVAIVKIPRLEGSLLTYRKFLDMQKDPIDSKRTRELYDKYRKDWVAKENRIFFE